MPIVNFDIDMAYEFCREKNFKKSFNDNEFMSFNAFFPSNLYYLVTVYIES